MRPEGTLTDAGPLFALVDPTEGGSLAQTCYLRPTYLFSTDERQITRKLDHLKPGKLNEVIVMRVRPLVSTLGI